MPFIKGVRALLIKKYLDRLCLQLKLPDDEKTAIREEMEAHLRERAHGFMVKGYTEEESARLALAGFGDPGEISRSIGRSTLRDRLFVMRNRLLEAAIIMLLPAMLAGYYYFFPNFDFYRSYFYSFEHPELKLLLVRVLLLDLLVVAAVMALYVPGWIRAIKRGYRWQINYAALVYLVPALVITAVYNYYTISIVAGALGDTFRWLEQLLFTRRWVFHVLMILMRDLTNPILCILIGIGLWEMLRFKKSPVSNGAQDDPGESRTGATRTRLLHLISYMAGIILGLGLVYIYFRFGINASNTDLTFIDEITAGAARSLVLIPAGAALGLPRLVRLFILEKDTVVFDWTRFAFFAVPGLFITFSYALYFHLPLEMLKDFLGLLFGYFEMQRWYFTGAIMAGLGFWMSFRSSTEQ